MEDLLKEDEFVIKEYFNPWKYFRKCYLIAFGCLVGLVVLLGLMSSLLHFSTTYVGVLVFVIPLFIVAYMVFKQKKLLAVPFGTVALGVFFLLSVFYVPVSLILISESGYNDAIIVLGVFTLLPLAVIMPVFNWRRKRFFK